jgi:alanine dehydrogenase
VLVGVPKEIKRDEYRVAILPVCVEEMARAINIMGGEVTNEAVARTIALPYSKRFEG